MIAPRDIRPERSLYAIGAALLLRMRQRKSSVIGVDKLYEEFSSIYNEEISYSYYIYALDWLYLLGLIDVAEGNLKIKKCF